MIGEGYGNCRPLFYLMLQKNMKFKNRKKENEGNRLIYRNDWR